MYVLRMGMLVPSLDGESTDSLVLQYELHFVNSFVSTSFIPLNYIHVPLYMYMCSLTDHRIECLLQFTHLNQCSVIKVF